MISQDKIHTSLVDFDNISLSESAQHIRFLLDKNSFSYVVTPNVDHLARLCVSTPDSELSMVYRTAALSLCDSRIVEKILRFNHQPIKAVVPGSDLTKYLFDNIFTSAEKIVVVGCNEFEIAALKERYTHLSIEHINPSMGFINKPDEVKRIIETINALNADYLLLAVGSPRQELLAYRLSQSGLSHGVALCIGASINFILGSEKRAPEWMQRLHIEWLYRMLQDPQRLVKRYAKNALYLPKIIKGLRG